MTIEPGSVRRGLQNTRSLHRLMGLPGIGARNAELLAARFDTWEEFVASDPDDLPGRSATKAADILRIARNVPEPELPDGVVALSRFDPEWPDWLRFDGAPAVVFVRGSIPPGNSLAVVGTRSPTSFGERAVRACLDTVREHIPSALTGIVSGLARGIDTRAHLVALEYGLPTWAILGSGVDTPTPTGNVGLAERILADGGGLLSEQLPGTVPTAGTLILRNRLQVASSSKVFVAECGVPSGTLHTVRYAVELGRKLIVAAPRSPGGRPLADGNRVLLDPAGCDPATLGASAATAEKILARRPVADAAFAVD